MPSNQKNIDDWLKGDRVIPSQFLWNEWQEDEASNQEGMCRSFTSRWEEYIVEKVERKERKRNAPLPYTTSSMQMDSQ